MMETKSIRPPETGGENQEKYLDPETLDSQDLERILKEGQVINIRPIENGPQVVPDHTDRVLLGEIEPYMPEHKDIVEMGEIEIPESGQKLLVVYKPERGVNKGTMSGEPVPLPPNSSPYSHKEVAAWKVARLLRIESVPVVLRQDLPEGEGSLRPYIWGEPLELLPSEVVDEALNNRKEDVENIALFDYLLQTLDRRNSNILLTKNHKLLPIDNSLTFIDEVYALRFSVKGPRLRIAFDSETHLKHTPLPERLITCLENLLDQKAELEEELHELLTKEEISGIFERTRALLNARTFL